MPTARWKKKKYKKNKNIIGRTIVLILIGFCLSIYKQFKQFYDLNNNNEHYQQEEEKRLIHTSFLNQKRQQSRRQQQQQQQQIHRDDDDDDTTIKAGVVIQKLLHFINNNRQHHTTTTNNNNNTNKTTTTTTTSTTSTSCQEMNRLLQMFQKYKLPSTMELSKLKYNVLHIGKAGGGSIITRLGLNWKLKVYHIHPIPKNHYFKTNNNNFIPLTIITIRDPIDRAKSAYYWRSLVLCSPYNETRPIGEATKDPTKSCKLSNKRKGNNEINVLFTKYKQRNINDIAERLCSTASTNDNNNTTNDSSDEARNDFKQIQHLEHKLTGSVETNPWLPFWLFNDENNKNNETQQSKRNNHYKKKQRNNNNYFIERIYPIVMERPYTIEKQIDLAVEWFYENEKFESFEEFELRKHYANLLDSFLQQCSSTNNNGDNTTTIAGEAAPAAATASASASGGGGGDGGDATDTIIKNDDDDVIDDEHVEEEEESSNNNNKKENTQQRRRLLQKQQQQQQQQQQSHKYHHQQGDSSDGQQGDRSNGQHRQEQQQQQQQQRRRRRLDENNNGEGDDDATKDTTSTNFVVQGGRPINIKQKLSSFLKNNRDRGGGGGGGGQRKKQQPPNNNNNRNKNKPILNMVEYQKRYKHSSVVHMPNQTRLSSKGEKCLMEYYQQDYEALQVMSTNKKYIWCKTMECQIAIDTILAKRSNLLPAEKSTN